MTHRALIELERSIFKKEICECVEKSTWIKAGLIELGDRHLGERCLRRNNYEFVRK